MIPYYSTTASNGASRTLMLGRIAYWQTTPDTVENECPYRSILGTAARFAD